MNETKDTLKELFAGLKEEDYFHSVNFHIHSTASDGKLNPQEIVDLARQNGLKHFAICDHNTFNAYKELRLEEIPELIVGIEFDCWYRGIFLHLLAYGVDINSEEIKPFLAKNKAETEKDIVRIFARRNVPKLIDAIHKAGGIAVLAHSACCWTINHEHFVKCMMKIGLDGLECYYPYRRHRGIIKFHRASSIKKIAEKYNLVKTGGTDAHGKTL